VTTDWVMTRKGFISQLATAVRSRIENDPGSVSWVAVGRAVLQALDGRHILIYVTQPDLAASMARQGWDGAIRAATSDYLMVVDASVGYGKPNAIVTQTVHYGVILASGGGGQATLDIDYFHSGKPGTPCQQELPYGPQITYQSMVDRCFYDYLRVYAPYGAQLLSSTRQDIPANYFLSRKAVSSRAEELEPEADKSVFAFLFVVETGKGWRTSLTYKLPAHVIRRTNHERQYSLWIQKQPGKTAIPTLVTVNLPPSARLVSTVPSATQTSVEKNQVHFEFKMIQDTYLEVRYRE